MHRAIARWEEPIRNAGFSLGRASTEIGKDRTYLGKMIRAAKRGDKVTPGADVIQGLAALLNIPQSDLLSESSSVTVTQDMQGQAMKTAAAGVVQKVFEASKVAADLRGNRMSAEGILGWWRSTGGLLDMAHEAVDSCDVIEAPAPYDDTIRPVSIGSRSLGGRALNGGGVKEMQPQIDAMTPDQRKALAVSYRYAASKDEPTLTGPHVMTIHSEGQPSRDVSYFRIQLPVRTPDGSRFILNYSFPA